MAFNVFDLRIEVDNSSWSEENDLLTLDAVRRAVPSFRTAYNRQLDGHELPRAERPARRRLRPEEIRVKSHKTFTISTVPATGLRNGLELSELSTSCSPVTVVTPATSSTGTPWSNPGRIEEIHEDEGAYNWKNSEQQRQNDQVVMPKLEPSEELEMDELYEVEDIPIPTTLTQPLAVAVPVKRGRGRPRKYPKVKAAVAKVNNIRCKTGCETCRRRKKKCDEKKPICQNCIKHNVHCGGYAPLKTLSSDKVQKAKEQQQKQEAKEAKRRASLTEFRGFGLPYCLPFIENELDKIFLKHYNDRQSYIFTVEDELSCSFRNIVLPCAFNDKGLMHSILGLASRHIDYNTPYGKQILLEHPNVNLYELQHRSQYHHEEAYKEFQKREMDASIAAIHFQVVFSILETLSQEHPKGDHRLHLKYSQCLPPPEDLKVRIFLTEWYRYHIFADQLISLPQPGHAYHNFHAEWNLPDNILQKGIVPPLGISNALLLDMSRITNLRNTIRENRKTRVDPAIGYAIMEEAENIDVSIRSWIPVWPASNDRELGGHIYQCMMLVYLFRTIRPTTTDNGWGVDGRITWHANRGIELLTSVAPGSKLQTLLLAPTFLIGCAAFELEQRQNIRKMLLVIQAYMGLRNTHTALVVLKEVWRLMDLRDERSWDWQTIAYDMGIDFSPT